MKAAIYEKYGSPEVIELAHVDKPEPKANEILVRIRATSVTSGDVRLRSSDFPPLFWLPARIIFGLFKPNKKILGHELAGVVEAVGHEVTKFKAGDEVFGTTTMLKTGAYAEYICLPQEWKHGVVELKPANLTFNEAAVLPIGSMTALFLLEKATFAAGQKILIYGASGSVGSYAVQLASQSGLSVTAVCSGRNIDMVKSLGAAEVIDYTNGDYGKLDEQFDIVFDAVGKIAKPKKLLKKGGAFVSVTMITSETNAQLLKIKALAESGKLKPFVDKTYPLEKIVEAHRYVDTGRKRGNLVIEVA